MAHIAQKNDIQLVFHITKGKLSALSVKGERNLPKSKKTTQLQTTRQNTLYFNESSSNVFWKHFLKIADRWPIKQNSTTTCIDNNFMSDSATNEWNYAHRVTFI